MEIGDLVRILCPIDIPRVGVSLPPESLGVIFHIEDTGQYNVAVIILDGFLDEYDDIADNVEENVTYNDVLLWGANHLLLFKEFELEVVVESWENSFALV